MKIPIIRISNEQNLSHDKFITRQNDLTSAQHVSQKNINFLGCLRKKQHFYSTDKTSKINLVYIENVLSSTK